MLPTDQSTDVYLLSMAWASSQNGRLTVNRLVITWRLSDLKTRVVEEKVEATWPFIS